MSVKLERHGQVGLVLLGDAARRNALSLDILTGALGALEESRRAGLRAVVIASSETAFCAGADIKDMLESGWLTGGPSDPKSPTPLDLFESIEADPRPVIAAVDGLALGGGVELTLACDLVLASEKASFALPEIGLGVIPNTAIVRLPEVVGGRIALELILTRRRIEAQEALSIGMVNRLVGSEVLIPEALGLASAIVGSAPPAAVAAVKRHVGRTKDWPAIRALLGSMERAEWEEGFSSFLAKRRPNYDGFWEKR